MARTAAASAPRSRRYAPRNGTIRGSRGAPQLTASRSAQGPAQKIACRAASCRGRGSDPRRRTTAARTAPQRRRGRSRPWIAASRANDAATAPKSVTPVAGECRAATPTAPGSISASSSAPIRCSPGTPLAVPRRRSSSSAGSSDVRRRDHHLARAGVLNAGGVAVGIELPCPLDAEARLEAAGRVGDAGVDDAARPAGLMGREAVLGLEQADPRSRLAAARSPSLRPRRGSRRRPRPRRTPREDRLRLRSSRQPRPAN